MLATMHGKEAAIAPVLLERLGLALSTAPDLDTDTLGTFTGEIPRTGAMRDAAVAKARLGMAATGLPIGIASEGSYGPHPHVPSTASGIEIMVLVDDTPIYDHAFAATIDKLGPYFDRTDFPDQALIVKPSEARIEAGPTYKGLGGRSIIDAYSSPMIRWAAKLLPGGLPIRTSRACTTGSRPTPP